MDTNKNKKLLKEFYEVIFQEHDLDAIDRFMHDDYIQHNPDADQGKAGFLEFHVNFFKAIPDHRADINMITADGNLVFVYNTITGTHTGEGFLNYPATGNKIKYDVVDMFRVEKGKLAEHWDVADTRALFTQVGGLKEIKF
ncbi:MAG: ester cyclase [Spirochaetes bacterium]|nr:ester cyclase [Spirochaetota bacterium]